MHEEERGNNFQYERAITREEQEDGVRGGNSEADAEVPPSRENSREGMKKGRTKSTRTRMRRLKQVYTA